MPKRDHFFKSKFLNADADLTGGPLTLTIRAVREDLIGPEKQLKALVDFDETEKALVLNATNFDVISEICGDENTDAWAGHRITLFRGSAVFGGKRVPAIRVRPSKPAPATPKLNAPAPPAEPTDDDLMPEWDEHEEEID